MLQGVQKWTPPKGAEKLRPIQTGAESPLPLEEAVLPLRYEIRGLPGMAYRTTPAGRPRCHGHPSWSPPRVIPVYQRPVLRASALGMPFRAARFFWISSSGST